MSTARKAAARGLRKTAHATTTTKARVGAHGVPNLDLTEAQWQARVTTLASFYGWRWYHPGDNLPTINLGAVQKALRARPGPWQPGDIMVMLKRLAHKQDVAPGFPDLVLARMDPVTYATTGYAVDTEPRWPELVFAELKAETGRLGPGQDAWAEALQMVAMATTPQDELADCPRPVEVHLWRPSQEDEVHARLARGRARIEPSWFVGEL